MLASGAALFSGSVKDGVLRRLSESDDLRFGWIVRNRLRRNRIRNQRARAAWRTQSGCQQIHGSSSTTTTECWSRARAPKDGWPKLGNVPLGYYKDPVKSAEIFREVNGARAVVTGDRARIEDDGSVTLLGRGNMVVNTGGEKVFVEEVEAVVKGPSRHLRRDSDRCSGRAVGQSGGGSASHPRRCGTGFRNPSRSTPAVTSPATRFRVPSGPPTRSFERRAASRTTRWGQGVLTEQRPGPPDRLALTRNTRHPAPIRKESICNA